MTTTLKMLVAAGTIVALAADPARADRPCGYVSVSYGRPAYSTIYRTPAYSYTPAYPGDAYAAQVVYRTPIVYQTPTYSYTPAYPGDAYAAQVVYRAPIVYRTPTYSYSVPVYPVVYAPVVYRPAQIHRGRAPFGIGFSGHRSGLSFGHHGRHGRH